MRMIAEFEKMGRMIWFSHLDLQSTMQRALRRAQLPVRYSQGFNPHVNLSFATALSVGMQSKCEILDVELTRELPPQMFVDKLNEFLPEGLKANRAGLIEDNATALMALMVATQCEVTVEGIDLTQSAEQFIAAQSVVVEKRTKTKTRDVDIRPMVYDLQCGYDGNASTLRMILEQTNANCLKPDLLMQAIAPEAVFRCVRTQLFAKDGQGQRMGLFEAGLGNK